MKKFENIVIAGATSLIAWETAKLFAQRHKSSFFLVGRDRGKLQKISEDLLARGATKVIVKVQNLSHSKEHPVLVEEVSACFPQIDLALLAWGVLGEEVKTQIDFRAAEEVLVSNFIAPVSLLTELGIKFERQGLGCIAVISSVAGDRGRFSNYVYGSSKAGLSAYLQGFRARMYHSGVKVLTIKPGPIATPMTAHLKRGLLMASAPSAARSIYCALRCHRDVHYVPKIWWFIMTVICLIPENIYKRLKL